MRTWIAIAISIACVLPAQAAPPAPAVGPRDAVEGAVGRFMTIVQTKGPAGVDIPDRSDQIRQIVREMFDFDEISKRALSRHWQTLQREEQAEFVALFRDLLERAYLAQVETASGSEKIAFTGESIEKESATVRSKVVSRQGSEMPIDYRLHVRNGAWRIYDVAVQGVSFIASYRTQFDRVIRAESYSSLRERLQKKATETTAAQR